MMIKKIYLSILVSILFFAACSDPVVTPEEKLIRVWKYTQMKFNSDVFSAERLGYPTMEFKADSTYSVIINDLVDSGTWEIVGDSLYTISNDKMEQTVCLIVLTTDSLVVSGLTQDKTPMELIMVADVTSK